MEKCERFKKVLKERVIIFDGAMGTMLQKLGLSSKDFGGPEFEMLSDILSISKPEALKNVHMEYLKAGADCIETNTFGASALRLMEYDFSRIDPDFLKDGSAGFDIRTASHDEIARHFNIASCKVARAAMEAYQNSAEYDGRELFVAGSVGPSNYVLSATEADLKKGTWELVEENFFNQVKGLIEGGADILLFETQQDILEVKAAVAGAKRAMEAAGTKLPVMVQVTVDEFSRMQIFNTDITAALTTVKDIGIDAFGINCSLGPDLMEPSIRKLSGFSDLPISVLPNAGLPDSEDGRTVYRLTPEDLARYLRSFVEKYGVNIVGGCCGTTPDHIRRIRAGVKGLKPAPASEKTKLFLSGPQNAVEIDGEKELIRIGERLNVRGSRKVRDAVESDTGTGIDYNVLDEVVREQIEDLGTSVIDICMDSAVVDTRKILGDVITSVTTDFKGVLCLDSFDPHALAEAVKVYPGRPLINSISMENYSSEKSKAEKILELTAFHSPVYIGLAADDNGPARTREEKIRIAEQLVNTCAKFDIPPARLLIDINAFPIGSESSDSMNFALESLEAIPEIKKLGKGLKTTIGVSNLTNGLAKKPYMRMVLTSVFLDEARKRGLDAAIVNPNHYVPVSSIDKTDYGLALGIILNRDMDAYAALEETARLKQGGRVVAKKRYENLAPADAVCEKIKDGIKNMQQGELIFNDKPYTYRDTIVLDASKALGEIDPLTFINRYLMTAMEALGDKFAAGEVSLPHLLKSADVMKQVMEFIEAVMNGSSGGMKNHRATIVLGTVHQDVHSIGKDLTRTLLENYGYRVIDLGVQVPLETFIETAKREKADAIGMSSLLVQTANHMITVAEMMATEDLDIPILIGGAPVNLRHAAYVAHAGRKNPGEMKKDVFYCASAMGCINVLENLFSEKRAEYIDNNGVLLRKKYLEAQEKAKNRSLKKPFHKKVDFSRYRVAECPVKVREFTPRVADIEINRSSLQTLNWKAGSAVSRKKQGITEESSNGLIDHWIHEADRNGWVQPKGRIGIFRCNSDGNSLVIYDPSDEEKEIARLDFEPSGSDDNRKPASVARYFLPRASGKKDIVGFQIATAGTGSGKAVEMFREDGDAESAHLLCGLANRVAEDFAGMLHHELKLSAGSDETSGKRYSPGYPGLKLENNRVIHDLLKADELGITMTEAHGFLPLSTTSALVCFHPDAEYF